MRILATFSAGAHAQARELKCDACGTRGTSVTFLVRDREEEGGAKMMVKKIKAGKVDYETKP
jgi:hypothetical protein